MSTRPTRPMVMIVPTRSRPRNAAALALIWQTTTLVDLHFVIDDNDPKLSDYFDLLAGFVDDKVHVSVEPQLGMSASTNRWARLHAEEYEVIGSMGDDHLPRTPGWDVKVIEAFEDKHTAIVYPNDGFQGEKLPTVVLMRSIIPQTLGFMMPPQFEHLFVDNVWFEWGRRSGCLRYLPDVLIEHMHPAAGKSAWDDQYYKINSREAFALDGQRFMTYMECYLERDLVLIKQALGKLTST
jgi:hypothetical protein